MSYVSFCEAGIVVQVGTRQLIDSDAANFGSEPRLSWEILNSKSRCRPRLFLTTRSGWTQTCPLHFLQLIDAFGTRIIVLLVHLIQFFAHVYGRVSFSGPQYCFIVYQVPVM